MRRNSNEPGTARRTLDELDPPAWPAAPNDTTRLIRRCHELRRVPLDQLSVEDLRLLIGQQIALRHTVPLALRFLDRDPMVSGDYYPGDLLEVTRQVPTDYWDDYQTS